MPQENLYNLIIIDKHAATPKYLQVIDSIIKAIEDGKIYQQTFIDTYTRVAFVKVYDRKNALVAADMLRVIKCFHSIRTSKWIYCAYSPTEAQSTAEPGSIISTS